MKCEILRKHIFDTVKEWQMKIGYMDEDMRLYYPQTSLNTMLGLKKNAPKEILDTKLAEFASEMAAQLGEIRISEKDGRYCLDISPQGCAYINREIPDPEFLKGLLNVITFGDGTLEKARECFAAYAKQSGCGFTEKNESEDGMGHVFYFEDPSVDEYVYCVEENEFGLTYHRFSRDEYENSLI
ncbi:MAG: DUF3877 family protein [Eubacteriales bacterium]|nr:DUF3877 family protein [Eubacteriales bacterium]